MNKYFFLILFLIIGWQLSSQSTDQRKIKVGLVLSGGGAKGFAHIGVLKAIEEAGVTIDFIGGTSMGAIVGSLYACGYSVDELEIIVQKMNFKDYLDNEVSRDLMPFYLREIDGKYAVKLPIFDNKIQLPSGWSNGQNVLNQLSKYTQHVSNVQDFNNLPIPFFCIATDLETGKQVILNKGNLPEAVRASAAFPTLVKPIEIDDKWLIDGGVVNNFPIDEVKNMGADFIIGVDVSSQELYKKKDLQSAINIMQQLVDYQMVNEKNLAKSNKADIYIRPINKAYNTFSFENAQDIIKLGYDTAIQQIDGLRELGEKQNSDKLPKKNIVVLDKFKVKGIHFSGNQNYKYAYLIEKLQLRLGKTITFDDLFNGINRLWATENFTQIQHHIDMEGEEGIIYIDLSENPTKSFVQLGLHYDDLFKAGVLLNWTSNHILFGTDHLSTDVVIGEKLRYNFDYFIDNGVHLSIGLQSVLQNFEFYSNFNENYSTFEPIMNLKTLDYLNVTNRLNFQYVYKDNSAFGFGLEHQYITFKDKSPNAVILDYENKHYANIYSYLKHDTYDHRMYPKSGIYFELNGKWYLNSKNSYDILKPIMQGKAQFGFAKTYFDKLTLQASSSAGLTFGNNSNPFIDFHLGGSNENYLNNFNEFIGYPFASMGNNSFLKTSISLRYEFIKNQYFGFITNVARTEDYFLKDFKLLNNTKSGFGIFWGYKSMAGPIQVIYAKSPELKKNYWSVKLGYWF